MNKLSLFLLFNSCFCQNIKYFPQRSNFKQDSDGVSFVVIGDYADMNDLSHANEVFDGIEFTKKNSLKGSPNDFDFIITTGDNIYPKVAEYPSIQEFNSLINLFQSRQNIKNLEIFPLRGNHETYFKDKNAEMQISKIFPNWKMHSNYYTTEFIVGQNNQKMVMLHIDSSLLICHTVSFDKILTLNEVNQRLYKENCFDEQFVFEANKQMFWIYETLQNLDQDKDIIWRASVMHHPIFGLNYPDFKVIIEDFLPLLKKYKFDLFINGHEHNQSYAYTSSLNLPLKKMNIFYSQNDICYNKNEFFISKVSEQNLKRQQKAVQGENIHQFTVGAGGRKLRNICESDFKKSFGNFVYAENQFYGFTLIHANQDELTVTMKGIQNGQVNDLYQFIIQRAPQKIEQLNFILIQNL